MRLSWVALLWLVIAVSPTLPCSCVSAPIDSSYDFADAVFRGHVEWSNDDDSGTFAQATLIGFRVSEVLKGLPSNANQVWVDPGSLTSCYAEYDSRKEYLIFARRGLEIPPGFASATSLAAPHAGKKPTPREFQSAHPPHVYWAPECTGSTETGYPGFEQDLETLRKYARGEPVPPIVGQVFLTPATSLNPRGVLAGASVTLQAEAAKWHTSTDANGRFYFNRILPEGDYPVTVEFAGVKSTTANLSVVAAKGNHLSVSVVLDRSIKGHVISASGKPVAGVDVFAFLTKEAGTSQGAFTRTVTNKAGFFELQGIPSEPVTLGVFEDSSKLTRMPDPAISYPAPITFQGNVFPSSLEIRVPRRPRRVATHLRVCFSDGAPARGAHVIIRDSVGQEISPDVDRNGWVTVGLAEGESYRAQAFRYIDRSPQEPWRSHNMLTDSVIFKAGQQSRVRLTMTHVRRYWDDSDK